MGTIDPPPGSRPKGGPPYLLIGMAALWGTLALGYVLSRKSGEAPPPEPGISVAKLLSRQAAAPAPTSPPLPPLVIVVVATPVPAAERPAWEPRPTPAPTYAPLVLPEKTGVEIESIEFGVADRNDVYWKFSASVRLWNRSRTPTRQTVVVEFLDERKHVIAEAYMVGLALGDQQTDTFSTYRLISVKEAMQVASARARLR